MTPASHLWYMRCQTWSCVGESCMGIPRVHHADIYYWQLPCKATPAAQLATWLTAAWGTALCWRVFKPHFRRGCNFYCRRQLHSGSTSISVRAGYVSSGPDRDPGNLFPARVIYFPGINIPSYLHTCVLVGAGCRLTASHQVRILIITRSSISRLISRPTGR